MRIGASPDTMQITENANKGKEKTIKNILIKGFYSTLQQQQKIHKRRRLLG